MAIKVFFSVAKDTEYNQLNDHQSFDKLPEPHVRGVDAREVMCAIRHCTLNRAD